MICNHMFFDILTWDEPWMTWYAISNSGRGFFSPSESVRAMSPPMKHHAVATETGNKCHWETSLMIKMAPHLTILPCYKFITPMNTIVICDCCLRSINFFLLKLWSNHAISGPARWFVYHIEWQLLLNSGWGGIFGWLNRFPPESEGPPWGDLARASGCYPPLVDD